jgi:AcrR family transcriptional regulator
VERASTGTGKRPALSPEDIVELAIAVADREGGLAAVSMRRLARELSVTPMALYWHFDNRDHLLDAMAEQVVEAAELTDLPDADWERRLRAVLASLITLLRLHPWMGRIVIERVVPLPRYLAALEALLNATRQAGLDVETATMLVQHAVQAVVSMVEDEPAATPDRRGPSPASRARQEFLSRLPRSEYPNILAAAIPLTTADPHHYYTTGLAMIVGGIRAVASQQPDPKNT